MNFYNLNISDDAEADLRDIWLYTVNRWGELQADKYMNELMKDCYELSESIKTGKLSAKLAKNVYYYRCNHHYIFYVKRNVQVVFIGFLHEKRNIIEVVAKRLS